MIIMCLAFLLVGVVAAALISYVPFIIVIVLIAAIGMFGTFFLNISIAQYAVVVIAGLCLAQVGYAAGLGITAVLYGASIHFFKGRTTKPQRSCTVGRMMRK